MQLGRTCTYHSRTQDSAVGHDMYIAHSRTRDSIVGQDMYISQ